jgi:SAM-dependent methyltransferase
LPGPANWAWDRYWHFDRVASCCDEGGRSNYDPGIADNWRNWFASVAPGTRVLDLCTGNGAIPLIALEVSERDDKHFAITGVDRAAINLAEFAVTRRERLARIEFRGEVEAEQLPFADGSFGAVSSQYGIEYSDLARSLPETVRVLSDGGRLRFCMHAAEGTVAEGTCAQLADADFVLDEVALPARAEDAFTAILAVERAGAPTDEEKAAADRAFAAFSDALAAIAGRIPQAADQKMLHSIGSVLAHAFEDRGYFELQVLLDKAAEMRDEVEAHRIRQRALVEAAVSREELRAIAAQLENLGLANVETTEVRPAEDRFLGYIVTGELRR